MRIVLHALAALAAAISGLACANRPGPLCLSGVTTYVEGAKGVTEDRQLYGSEATVGGSVGYEARVGVALEWDPSGYACETEE